MNDKLPPPHHEHHTVTWRGGLRVTRLATHRDAIYLEVEWRGGKHTLRVLRTKVEVMNPGE